MRKRRTNQSTLLSMAGLLLSVVFLQSPAIASSSEPGFVFAAVVGQGQGDLVRSSGARILQLCGPSIGWDNLMPDGKHFDPQQLEYLDGLVGDADKNGLKILFRFRSGGGAMWSFQAIPNKEDYPVDLSEYPDDGPTGGYKGGEYLGNRERGLAELETNWPPKVLTDDLPGNTSPWYDFCHAVASRYNGKTPDPKNPGKVLPRIDYFSTSGEMDTKHYWYGTTRDYFGFENSQGMRIGYLPTVYRAVKAANPSAQVVEGGFVCYQVGWYMVHELAQEEGSVNQKVLEYNNRYFKYSPLHGEWSFQFPGVLERWLDSQEVVRSRMFIDKWFESSAFMDILSFHSYEDYLMHDTIRFLKKKMAEYAIHKPIWGKEIGIPGPFPAEETARVLLKKFVMSFAEGVQVCTVSPFVAFPGVEGEVFSGLHKSEMQLYRVFNPSASVSELEEKFGTPLLGTYKLLSQNLAGCTLEQHLQSGEAALYLFFDTKKGKRIVVGWTENPDDQLIPADYLSLRASADVAVYDSAGNFIGSSLPEGLDEDPFVLVSDGADGILSEGNPGDPSQDPDPFAVQGADENEGGVGCNTYPHMKGSWKRGVADMITLAMPAFLSLLLAWARKTRPFVRMSKRVTENDGPSQSARAGSEKDPLGLASPLLPQPLAGRRPDALRAIL